MNKPVAWGWYDLEIKQFFPHWDEDLMENKEGCIPLYTHPANACKHGVDDGACKECYLESSNPYKAITNKKIEPTAVSYTHPVKELTDEEIKQAKLESWQQCKDTTEVIDFELSYQDELFARAILRKAQEK